MRWLRKLPQNSGATDLAPPVSQLVWPAYKDLRQRCFTIAFQEGLMRGRVLQYPFDLLFLVFDEAAQFIIRHHVDDRVIVGRP